MGRGKNRMRTGEANSAKRVSSLACLYNLPIPLRAACGGGPKKSQTHCTSGFELRADYARGAKGKYKGRQDLYRLCRTTAAYKPRHLSWRGQAKV